MDGQAAFPFVSGQLTRLLADIAIAGKIVNHQVNRAGLAGILGEAGGFNVQEEAQQKLDVFADPQGGHYKSPTFYRMLRGEKTAAEAETTAGPDPNAGGQLEAPGLKVFHVQDVDYLSTTPTFSAALTLVRDWSRAHPRHVPILVLVELKDEAHGLLPTRPVPFDAERIDEVDREIARVFSREQVLTPDDLRGDEPSLAAAVRQAFPGMPRLLDA